MGIKMPEKRLKIIEKRLKNGQKTPEKHLKTIEKRAKNV
jgi:hypothetical protein